MRQIFRNPAKQAEYLPTGHAKTPMLSSAEVQELLREVQSLRPHDKFAPKLPNGLDTTYHWCPLVDVVESKGAL